MIVYFDTNVFDHLEQRSNGATEEDLFRIGRAVKLDYIRVVISFLAIEETLLFIQSDPKRADTRVKLMLELGDKRLFVRGQEMIVSHDFQAYAYGTPSHSPFMLMDPWIEFHIRNFSKPTGDYLTDWQGLTDEVRRDKMKFQTSLDEGKKKVKPLADAIGIKQYPFEQYLAMNSEWLVEGLADSAGVLQEVRQRGVDGALKIKSIGVAVGANLSLIYSHHFENRAPKSGDSRDMLHAVLASTADVFVTDDGPLETILTRVPVDGFKVMNLRAFMDSLPEWI